MRNHFLGKLLQLGLDFRTTQNCTATDIFLGGPGLPVELQVPKDQNAEALAWGEPGPAYMMQETSMQPVIIKHASSQAQLKHASQMGIQLLDGITLTIHCHFSSGVNCFVFFSNSFEINWIWLLNTRRRNRSPAPSREISEA